MTDSASIATPEPEEIDEQNSVRLQHLVEDAVLRGKPYHDEKCRDCRFYLDTDADIAYCWHPKLRILVGENWWCQWFEQPD